MQKSNGSFYQIINVATGLLEDTGGQWSKQPGAFHAKLAIPYLDLYGATGELDYHIRAVRLLDWTLTTQQADGRFITCAEDGSTFLHAHCYALEGMLAGVMRLGKRAYALSVKAGIDWLVGILERKGCLPAIVYTDGSATNDERSDVLAQTLRLLVIGRTEGLVSQSALEVCHTYIITRLAAHVCCSDDPNAALGTLFSVPVGSANVTTVHVNTWATMFVIQALRESVLLDEGRTGSCNTFV